MLGKLMKYELKGLGRIFLPLYGAMIVISIINRILGALNLMIPMAIGTSVYSIMLSGVCVLTLVLTLQRFRKNLLGSEGYLMFTLPVSTDSLIISKLITAFILFVLSFLTLLVSLLVMSAGNFSFSEIIHFFNNISSHLGISNLDFALIFTEGLVIGVLMVLGGIMMLYTCISLSLLVNKRRGLFAFGAFVVISMIWQIITTALMKLFFIFRPEVPSLPVLHKFMVFGIFGALVYLCIFYFLTRFMLTRKLNLE